MRELLLGELDLVLEDAVNLRPVDRGVDEDHVGERASDDQVGSADLFGGGRSGRLDH